MTCPGFTPPSTAIDEDYAERLTCEGTASQYHRSPAHPHLFCGCGDETTDCHPGRCCRDDDWGQCVNCGLPAPEPDPLPEDQLSDGLFEESA